MHQLAAQARAVKLTVEMIPRTCWFSNLRTLLPPEDWDKMRRWCYGRAGYVCEICGGVGPDHPVEAHEIWEYDDETHVQRLAGLIALCSKCHQVKHLGHTMASGHGAAARCHLRTVNGWGLLGMLSYLQGVVAKQEERSEHEWKLDLSWLDNFDVVVKHIPRSQPDDVELVFDFSEAE
jgi:hypothetical protein